MELDLSTSRVDDHAVVTVTGEVDLESAAQLGDHALDAMRDISPRLVLDLSGVTFMDSTGLKVLLSLQHRTELAGGSLDICCSRSVLRVITLTGLDQTLRLHDTVEAALDDGQRLP